MAALIAGLLVWGPAATAGAHDPVFLTDEQTTPETGPYFPDGTVSWAIYSTLHESGETRAFEFDLADGDRLILGLLIPNLEPELSLDVGELPTLTLEYPDGSIEEIEPEIGAVFDEPFSGTSYVRLHSSRADGQSGRYRATVNARAPVRVSVAIGDREVFGTAAERVVGRSTAFGASGSQIDAWYSTPPGRDDQATTASDDRTTTLEAEQADSNGGAPNRSTADPELAKLAGEPDAVGAYVGGPVPKTGTDRLVFPIALLAAALVITALARTVRRRLT